MKYNQILSRINGQGIQEYDQDEEATLARVDIHNGVCRALVIMWLQAKKTNQDFWNEKETVRAGLLDEINKLEKAVDLQEEYKQFLESRFVPDSTTLTALEECKVYYEQKDVIASAQWGFAQEVLKDELISDEPEKIATKVLSADSRFFILSVQGSSGCHSIGIHRPYSLIGKSSDAYLFDPNIGEFKVSNILNLKLLMIELNRLGYASSNIDLNKSYILWSYSTPIL